MTRASGKTVAVMHRRIKNHRLADAGYRWAFTALTASPGARAHHDRRRHAGDLHAAAQRNLFNRLVGYLHHCPTTGQTYQESIAFRTRRPSPTPQLDTFTAWDVYISRDLFRTLTVAQPHPNHA